MSPAYWVYLVMAVTVLFNAMKGVSRFRLWRIDAAREKLEARPDQLAGPDLTRKQMRADPPKQLLTDPGASATARDIMDQLTELRARCQRYTSSVVTPMGDEMFYRYQEILDRRGDDDASRIIPTRAAAKRRYVTTVPRPAYAIGDAGQRRRASGVRYAQLALLAHPGIGDWCLAVLLFCQTTTRVVQQGVTAAVVLLVPIGVIATANHRGRSRLRLMGDIHHAASPAQ